MKRLLLCLPILILTGFGPAYAQAGRVPVDPDYYRKYHPPIANEYIFIQGGPLFALSDFGQDPAPGKPVLDPFLGEDGMGGGTGFHLGVGIRGAVEEKDFRNRVYFTMNMGLEYYRNPVDWSEIDGHEYNFETTKHWSQFNFSIGPGLSYNLNDFMVFEANLSILFPFYTSFPEIAGGNGANSFSQPADFHLVRQDDPTSTTRKYKPSIGLGLRARTQRFVFGIERFNYTGEQNYDLHYYSNAEGSKATTSFTSKMKWTALMLTVGLTL